MTLTSPSLMTPIFASADTALRYMSAGQAVVTFRSIETGKWFTYQINCSSFWREVLDEEPLLSVQGRFERAPFWVRLLVGGDDKFVYLGTIEGPQFKLTPSSKMTDESLPVRAFRWAWRKLWEGEIPTSLEILHEGKCGRCGRALTTPISIALGLGPECAMKRTGGN